MRGPYLAIEYTDDMIAVHVEGLTRTITLTLRSLPPDPGAHAVVEGYDR